MKEKIKLYFKQLICRHKHTYYVTTYTDDNMNSIITVFCKDCGKQLTKNIYEGKQFNDLY